MAESIYIYVTENVKARGEHRHVNLDQGERVLVFDWTNNNQTKLYGEALAHFRLVKGHVVFEARQIDDPERRIDNVTQADVAKIASPAIAEDAGCKYKISDKVSFTMNEKHHDPLPIRGIALYNYGSFQCLYLFGGSPTEIDQIIPEHVTYQFKGE